MEFPVCPQCGRLMAEEAGPLCDKCGPASVVAEAPGPWVTWALIAVTAVASAAGLGFSHEQFPLGAKFGPGIAGGEWWRLVTAFFVHNSLGHFVWNMIPLGFLGGRLERNVGHWVFLAFYLTCGITGSVVSLIAAPEQVACGASGAVFGVCAGLFVYYLLRVRTLSRKQRIRLAALGIYIWTSFWPGFADLRVDNACHLAGLTAGAVLGCVLSLGPQRKGLVPLATFSAAAAILVLGAFEFRQRNLYLVHLDAAARAIQNGKMDLAAAELRTAQTMKPDSPIGQFLQQKLDDASR